MISVEMDELWPLLKDLEAGVLISAEIVPVQNRGFLAGYNEHTGWKADWQKLHDSNDIFALVLSGTYDVQGMLAMHSADDPAINAAHIVCMVDAPRNRITDDVFRARKYSGVGGFLLAAAGEYAHHHGYPDDAVYGEVKDRNMLDIFTRDLGAASIASTGKNSYRFLLSGAEMRAVEIVYKDDLPDGWETSLPKSVSHRLHTYDWAAYREEAKRMPSIEEIEAASHLSPKVNWRGLIEYARSQGKHVPDLTDEEKARFVEGGIDHLREYGL